VFASYLSVFMSIFQVEPFVQPHDEQVVARIAPSARYTPDASADI
jgi:hypothetical protein